MSYIIFAMVIFSITHSLLAGDNCKTFIRKRMGERAYFGLYRIGYNVIAGISLAPIILLMVLYPGDLVWSATDVVAVILLVIQAAGIMGLLISLLQIDLGQFTGLSQLRAYLNNQPLPLPTEPLQTNGVYKLVRHPLYLFSLMAIWPFATMSQALFAFNTGATLYFIFGSLLEERRLLAIFGQSYRDYRQRVPWLIPFLKIRH